jgi:hypothetical protein
MMGCTFIITVCSTASDLHISDGADKGIIPLTCSELFRQCDERAANDPNLSFVVEVSYIEVGGIMPRFLALTSI